MADKYAVNYNDEKLVNIQEEQANKEAELTKTYDNMINNTDKYYDAQIEASKQWANKQTEIQQANTNFAIEKIEQQKEQANKDYIKEQKGAYADYKTQTSDYSANAEEMAAAGLNNTGYSETSKVSMYNTYQNRVATARESYDQIVLNYNNAIKEAQLANNSALAQIAADALKQQLELNLQGFQYKNTLIQTKQEQLANNGDRYNQRYQQMLSQINDEINRKMQYDTWEAEFDAKNQQWEREFEEQQRQWQKQYDAQQRQYETQRKQWQQEYALKQQQAYQASKEYKVKEDKPTKLSKKGQAFYKEMVKNKVNIGSLTTEELKNKCKNVLNLAYQHERIEADDVRILASMYGLE